MKKGAFVIFIMSLCWNLKAQDYELLLLGEYTDTVNINKKLQWYGIAEYKDSLYLTEVNPKYMPISEGVFSLETSKKLATSVLIGTLAPIYKEKQEKIIWEEKFFPGDKRTWQENIGSFEHLEAKGELIETDSVQNYELYYKFEMTIVSKYSKNINPIILNEVHKRTGETYTYLTEAPLLNLMHIDNEGSKDLIIKYREYYFFLSVDCCMPEKKNIHVEYVLEDLRVKGK